MEQKNLSRRNLIKMAGSAAAGTCLFAGCEKKEPTSKTDTAAIKEDFSNEEYVWLSAKTNQPLFVAHDHPALFQAGKELGVKVTIAGPNTQDMTALVAAFEQIIARKPAGMMVVGWEPSALIVPINRAIEKGIPVVCVDADVPKSKRYAFIGSDWYALGIHQAEAMVKALNGKTGKVALLGLLELYINQQAFAGFRSVAEKAGLEVMEPQQDMANVAHAARIASAVIQSTSGLVGIAGFNSLSGPGIGMAIKELNKTGKIIATSVDAEERHLRLVKEGVLTAVIGQKRELFTYYGTKALFDINHSPLKFTADDKKAGIVPIPDRFYTGSYKVTQENVDSFLS